MPKFDARFRLFPAPVFSCRHTTSNVVDCLRTTLEVVHRHEKLAPESGVEVMTPISRACVRGIKHVRRSESSDESWRSASGIVTHVPECSTAIVFSSRCAVNRRLMTRSERTSCLLSLRPPPTVWPSVVMSQCHFVNSIVSILCENLCRCLICLFNYWKSHTRYI